MCGIFGIAGKKHRMANTILEDLKLLEYRGYDSWGIAVAVNSQSQKSKFLIEKHVGKIGKATLHFPLSTLDSTLGIGHTRWATHGGVTVKNAHPHLDCQDNIALVHNGIVENFEEIKKNFEKHHVFRSQTDTEVVVHLIEELMKKTTFTKAVRQAFLKLKGLNAIVVLSKDQDKIVAVKNGSPLIVAKGNKSNYIASDQTALSAHARSIAHIPDNALVELTAAKISAADITTGKKINLKFTRFQKLQADSSLGKWHHFMEKEIHQQPDVIRKIAAFPAGQIQKAATLVKHAKNIYLVGSGSASYAALSMEYLLSGLCRINSQAVVASEFENLENFLKKGDLVIAYSQSGETADLIDALKSAKARAATVFAIVNTEGSTIDRMANASLHLGAGPEIAVVSTKAFVTKIALSLLIVCQIQNRLEEGRQILQNLALSLEKLLRNQKIESLANKLKGVDHLYTIGRNLDYPIALEAALKLKETAYIHAEGFAAGELKHGVIALIEKGTPAIVFATQEKYLAQTLSSAEELSARGACIIGISIKPNKVFDYYLPVPNLNCGQIICAVVYAQYLAYLVAIKRDLDPDRPRNLAKSVTVK